MSTNAPFFSINILDMHLGHKGRGNWEINRVFFFKLYPYVIQEENKLFGYLRCSFVLVGVKNVFKMNLFFT